MASKVKSSIMAALMAGLLLILAQVAFAGGGSLTVLIFPDANALNCGTWQATGSLSTAAEVSYILQDGNGIIVAEGTVPSVYSVLSGTFTTTPSRNPLHLMVYSGGWQVSNLVADNPCLAPAMTPTPPIYLTPIYLSPTPFMTAQPQPTSLPSIPCTGAPTSRLLIGMDARVTPGLPNILRDLPGLRRDGSRIIGSIPGGGSFSVIDGPVCASGYLWWKVNYNGTLGWTAEGRDNTYWLEPLG